MSDPRKLRLVTGSRAFAEDPRKEAWARRRLRELLEPLDGADVVLSGRCPASPDAWAAEIALERGIYLVEFALDGRRYHNGVDAGTWVSGQSPKDPRWPLLRNDALVGAAGRAKSTHLWDVACAAFVDPTARTQGTKYTADKAAAWGIEVALHEVPAVTGLPLVFFDCETTGTSSADVMIEAGFITTDAKAGEILNRWERKIAIPDGVTVPPGAAAVNGYTPEGWLDARPMAAVMEEMLRELPPQFVFVAHNVGFDHRFVVKSLAGVGLPEPGWTATSRDTVRMARQVVGKKTANHKLATLCEYFAISNRGEHGAMADCERMLEVYRCLVRAVDSNWE